MNVITHSFKPRLAILAVAGLAAFLLLGPAGTLQVAHAQSAACPQYEICGGEEPKGGGGGAGGELPFTGYPVTPLILLLVVLLAAGLLTRTYLAARDRLYARQAASGGLPIDFG